MARRPSERQLKKNEETRQKLLESALKVVGRVGYGRASISKIAELAGVSTGTFYLHFKSKEHLYDTLLPWANQRLTAYVTDRVGHPSCYMAFEEANIRGFFEYIAANPAFLQVMMEAEFAAPKAWREYLALREAAYLERLTHAWRAGEFPDYEVEDMPALCALLIGLRRALVSRNCDRRTKVGRATGREVQMYLGFVFGALHRSNADAIRRLWTPTHDAQSVLDKPQGRAKKAPASAAA
jgi:AcrR family transcriptional regulator